MDGLHERGVLGQAAAGAGAGLADFTGDFAEGGFFVFPLAGAGDGGVENDGHALEEGFVDAAEIEAGAGEGRDGIDGHAAFDDAEVEGKFGGGGREVFGEDGDHSREGVDGVADAVVDPAVAAGALKGDFVAAAGECFGGDVFGGGAVEDEERPDAGGERRGGAEVEHAAEVAVAFFADVGDEDGGGGEAAEGGRRFHGADEGEEAGEAGAVVADAGADEGAVGFGADVVGGAGGENGIEVSGDGDVGRRGGGLEEGHDVAGLIDFGVTAELAEGGEHPFGAALFLEGGRGDAAELEMLFVDPLFIAGKLLERLFYAAGAGKGVEIAGCRCEDCAHWISV